MVLQEIDHKIHQKSEKNSGFRGAAKFIHNLLSKDHPRVKGEKATEAIIGNDFNELMADDSILNCAMKCSKLTQVKTVGTHYILFAIRFSRDVVKVKILNLLVPGIAYE